MVRGGGGGELLMWRGGWAGGVGMLNIPFTASTRGKAKLGLGFRVGGSAGWGGVGGRRG